MSEDRRWRLELGGCHRTVLLLSRYVFKVPIMGFGLSWWVRGWLANLREREEWRLTKDPGLCPVLLSLFGLVIVMRRCETVPPVEHDDVLAERAEFVVRRGYECSAEPYAKSYGRLNGRVVAFDYGRVA